MKNTEVEKIRYCSALVGQLGWSKNNRSHINKILCCSFPNVTRHNKFYPNWMKYTDVQIYEILGKQKRFQKSAKTTGARAFCMVSLDSEICNLGWV